MAYVFAVPTIRPSITATVVRPGGYQPPRPDVRLGHRRVVGKGLLLIDDVSEDRP